MTNLLSADFAQRVVKNNFLLKIYMIPLYYSNVDEAVGVCPPPTKQCSRTVVCAILQ